MFRPDVTAMVHWALKINYISIYLSIITVTPWIVWAVSEVWTASALTTSVVIDQAALPTRSVCMFNEQCAERQVACHKARMVGRSRHKAGTVHSGPNHESSVH